jgi:hypothetical protein
MKKQFMEITFNWFKYSFILSIRKNVVRLNTTAEGYGVGQANSADTGRFQSGHDQSRVGRHIPEKDCYFFKLAQVVKSEIKNHMMEVSLRRPGKEELIISLHRLLRPHSELSARQAYPFRVAINNVLQKEASKHCSIQLNNEDLQTLWCDLS